MTRLRAGALLLLRKSLIFDLFLSIFRVSISCPFFVRFHENGQESCPFRVRFDENEQESCPFHQNFANFHHFLKIFRRNLLILVKFRRKNAKI